VKKLVLLENKSVNDFKVIGGINGDDAIEPGAPPTCFGGCCPATFPGAAGAGAGAGAATGAFIFDDDDDEDDARLRKLRFFFAILTQLLGSK
jgi:hypothetical protein